MISIQREYHEVLTTRTPWQATITSVEDTEFNRRIVFTVPEKMMKYILPKVSILPVLSPFSDLSVPAAVIT